MQPGVAYRYRFGGCGDARTDELRGHATALRLLGIRRQRGYVEIGVEADLRIRESSCAIGVIRRCRTPPRAPTVRDGLKALVGVLEPEDAHLHFKM